MEGTFSMQALYGRHLLYASFIWKAPSLFKFYMEGTFSMQVLYGRHLLYVSFIWKAPSLCKFYMEGTFSMQVLYGRHLLYASFIRKAPSLCKFCDARKVEETKSWQPNFMGLMFIWTPACYLRDGFMARWKCFGTHPRTLFRILRSCQSKF